MAGRYHNFIINNCDLNSSNFDDESRQWRTQNGLLWVPYLTTESILHIIFGEQYINPRCPPSRRWFWLSSMCDGDFPREVKQVNKAEQNKFKLLKPNGWKDRRTNSNPILPFLNFVEVGDKKDLFPCILQIPCQGKCSTFHAAAEIKLNKLCR